MPCPERYYCPEGTIEPILCPSGTFGRRTGLEVAIHCASCSAGRYCNGGVETGLCSAGYYCKLRNAEPNPNNTGVTGIDFGGPCPTGHYCPEGVLEPLPCPNFTARLQTHGANVDDCGPCPAGMSCEDGSLTILCPRGTYCSYGRSSVLCPPGTYNLYEGKTQLEDCLPCPAGKLCNRTGIIDPANYDCPPGHYCLLAESDPKSCPAGTYRGLGGGTNAEDCQACVGGSYCSVGAVQPIVCDSKTFCPIGTGLPAPCPGGSYCPFNSSEPILCPEGYYCPNSVDQPVSCSRGYYCPAGTSLTIPCPLGYIGRETPLRGSYTTLDESCESCSPGTAAIALKDTFALEPQHQNGLFPESLKMDIDAH
uniref:Tyrosine-protein kinase ephrin type A/B receptor-like domain-containing protein n=1 Tax=Globisporangium ultimum (strain ATCC 200006 / CBS 805.95 / DAOM BR144) TaxID=431595 RepID=K3WJP6_GLOUD